MSARMEVLDARGHTHLAAGATVKLTETATTVGLDLVEPVHFGKVPKHDVPLTRLRFTIDDRTFEAGIGPIKTDGFEITFDPGAGR